MSAAGSVLVVVCASAATLLLVGQVTGRWRVLPILSGSMAPQMAEGDLAWLQPKLMSELRVGDVLVYNSPQWGSSRPRRTIHRVIQIVDPSLIRPVDLKPGVVYIRTKGDANEDPDPWIAAIDDNSVWVRTRVVPYLGRPLLVIGTGNWRTVALVAAGLLMAGFAISTLVRRQPEEAGSKRRLPPPRLPLPVATRKRQRAWSQLLPATEYGPRSGVHERTSTRRWDSAAASVSLRAYWGSGPSLRTAAAVGAAGALTLAAAGITAALAAGLIETEHSSGTVSAGAVVLEIGTSTLPVTVSDLLPGEQVERVVELRNTGSIPLGWMLLEVTGDPGSMLDPTGGLQLSLQRCSSSWQVGTGPDGQPSAQCPSSVDSLVADRPLLGRTDLDLLEVDSDEPGGIDQLRLAIYLPDRAGISIAGESATVTVRFLGGQREGRAQ